MMRLTVEIVPFGEEDDKKTIHTIVIGNMGRVMPRAENRWADDLCVYSVSVDGEALDEQVHHHRGEGALVLAEKVLALVNEQKE
jgi:hypothetical protein